MNRHSVRSIILQVLFELDFLEYKNKNLTGIIEYAISIFNNASTSQEISKEIEKTVKQVLKKKDSLDEIIAKAAPEWPINKIAIMDRNILRLGIYELLFEDHEKVPPKVAINEAVELAKQFGSENSSKFVNGVIGAVYREIGEPGKSEKKSKINAVKKKDLPVEAKIGALIYNKDENELKLCLVHDIFGRWTVVRGSLDKGENTEGGVVRKSKQEAGLDVKIGEKIGENEYIARQPKNKHVLRKVEYYLAEAPYKEPKLGEDVGGLDDVKWFIEDDLPDLNIYPDVLTIIKDGIEKIK